MSALPHHYQYDYNNYNSQYQYSYNYNNLTSNNHHIQCTYTCPPYPYTAECLQLQDYYSYYCSNYHSVYSPDLQHLSPSPGNGSNSSIAGVMSLASMAAATPSPTHSLHAMGMGGSNIFITPPSHHMHSPPEIAGMGGLSPEGIEGVSALSPSSLNMAAVFANSAHHNTPMGGSPGNNSMGVKNHQMCGECGKVFTSSSALAKHKLTHSDERRYSCNLCHKRFKRQDHL